MTKNVFLTSDSHFGHSNILTFLGENGLPFRVFESVEAMDEHMIERWNSVVKPHDKVYHLGDVFINRKFAHLLGRLNGDKVLIKGNHDIFQLEYYLPYFRDIRAYHKLDKMILSHIPIYAGGLDRFKMNIHGHLHEKLVMTADGIPDPRYLNVCVEHTNYTPIEFSEVQAIFRERGL